MGLGQQYHGPNGIYMLLVPEAPGLAWVVSRQCQNTSDSMRESIPANLEPRLISGTYSDRPTAPSDVWDWQAFGSWRNIVWELIGEIVDVDVRSTFLKRPPEYVVCDDLDWLDNIIFSTHHQFVDSKLFLAEKLEQHFRCFRAAHGTRLVELRSIYQEGLVPLDPTKMQERARSIFLTGEFPELSSELLGQAFKAVCTRTREGRVYFEGKETMLVKMCGQYMLYGSEYMLGVAAHLGNYRDYRQRLKRYGEPTVFVCYVPISLMRFETIMEFAGIALEMIFEELLHGEGYVPDRWRGACFSIDEKLPGSCILGHYRPSNIRDPLFY